jgi:integrase
MPKLNKSSNPKYRKHRPTGQAVVTIAGKTHYLGPHGTEASHVEYDRLIAEWLVAGRPSDRQKLEPIRVVEIIDRYLVHAGEYYVKNGRPTSEVPAIKSALAPLNDWYADTAAEDFGPLALKAVRKRIIDEKDWSRGVINAAIQRIRRMFKWAASEQLTSHSVWHSLQSVDGLRRGKSSARDSLPIMPVAGDVVDATLPYLPPIVADMVRVQQLTGCRPEEVCLIRPGNVQRHGDVWRIVPDSHKTEHHGRERIIFVGPQAQDVLRPYLLRDKSSYCFSPRESESQRLAVRHEKRVTPLHWGNRPGLNRAKHRRRLNDHYAVAAYRRAITRAVELANRDRAKQAKAEGNAEMYVPLPGWAPNQLRHAMATTLRAKFGLDVAATILGHSKPDTTLIYAERDLATAERIIRVVG